MSKKKKKNKLNDNIILTIELNAIIAKNIILNLSILNTQ